MSSYTFTDFKKQIYVNGLSLPSVVNTLKLALLSTATIITETDVTAILASKQTALGGGYLGPVDLTNVKYTLNGTVYNYVADDLYWYNSSISALGAIVYIDNGVTKSPVSFLDFGATQTSLNGQFVVPLSKGIFQTV